ncbi:GTPase domain-containing protein [Lewinella sp. W8]|uniref:GTPase domain-containing protein n=1 Tax=Lewinella sp. W8 TaxID=2528208 RepID=UPI0015674578|nr:GTPase domain-containing protein [Lewinella sp. W8]
MEISDWADFAGPLKYPYHAYKHRKTLQKYWKWILATLDKTGTEVVILGRPGVGKSVLAAYLYNETNNLSWELPQTSTEVEVKAITFGDWTNLVRVIPGQTTQERLQGLSEAFEKSKSLEGVIYVVDFGYTDIRSPVVKQDAIENRGLDSIDKIRRFNLLAELEDFKKVSFLIEKSVANGKQVPWLLIVVNKADLFFESTELLEAETYYHPEGGSQFSQLIENLYKKLGSQRLKIASVPLSCYQKPFHWNKEEVMSKIGDDDQKKKMLTHFFNKISQLR